MDERAGIALPSSPRVGRSKKPDQKAYVEAQRLALNQPGDTGNGNRLALLSQKVSQKAAGAVV